MRCWWCGVEPTEVFDLHEMGLAWPVRQIAYWGPNGDHRHSEQPPTADELAEEAYRLLNGRINQG